MTTKEKVSEKLLLSGGKIISGQELAEECQMSRAAIWKAINSLREEGLEIEGSTNVGYRLLDNDIFNKNILEKQFISNFPEFKNSHIECFQKIDSTNTHAKKILNDCGALRTANGELSEYGKKYHQSIIVAEEQTAGRGRLGRTFVSPKKSGIYLSIIYAPKGGITSPARITASSAVAICRAIKKLYNLEPQIKWINDIFIDGKKICGILAEGLANFENQIIESAIIGIGINLRQSISTFDPELSKIAGSLEEAILKKQNNENAEKIELNRCLLAIEIAGQVLRILNEDSLNEKKHTSIMNEYRNLSFVIGKEVTVFPLIGENKKSYKAKAIAIDDNASLIVKDLQGKEHILNSGEVSLRTKNAQSIPKNEKA